LLRVHCPTGPATRTATILRSLLVIAEVFRANRLERVRQEEVANRLDLEQQVARWVKSQNFRAYLKAVEQEAVQREISIAPEAPLGRWLSQGPRACGSPGSARSRLAVHVTILTFLASVIASRAQLRSGAKPDA